MKWGEAAEHRNRLQERLVALEGELARLNTEMLVAEERRLTLADLIDHRANETADRLIALTQRIETLEAGRSNVAQGDQPVDEAQLAEALLPLKMEIAAMAQQAAIDERQAQQAYLELVAQLERIKRSGKAQPTILAEPASRGIVAENKGDRSAPTG